MKSENCLAHLCFLLFRLCFPVQDAHKDERAQDHDSAQEILRLQIGRVCMLQGLGFRAQGLDHDSAQETLGLKIGRVCMLQRRGQHSISYSKCVPIQKKAYGVDIHCKRTKAEKNHQIEKA